ncbi:hypothetical protein ACFQ1S_36440 [Kibdelosporangium lantanae]|uniref:FXSXX-COOH protein n=1 Tax=Kibdelosporangium lantanae TaxID=1497396 RepID=A0ABW3MME1_9PSEU
MALFRRSTADDTDNADNTEHSDPTIEVNAEMIAGLDETSSAAEPSETSVTEELLDQALTELFASPKSIAVLGS